MPRFKVIGYASLLLLFFVSGACGLAYQMAWSRMLASGLGHEMPAVLAVVAAIFGGIAAGAWWSDSYLERTKRPGRCYAWLECLIGFWGFISIGIIHLANNAAGRLVGPEAPVFWQWLIAFALPCLLLFPSTAAMGATFPAMERFAVLFKPGGRIIGALYGANTLGAVSGVLSSTFWVLPTYGFRRGINLFSMLSILVGAVALVLEKRLLRAPSKTDSVLAPAVSKTRGASSSTSVPARGRLITTLGLTGLFGIGYEILGVRMLAQVLENTVYSFAAGLMVFLFGSAVGAFLYQLARRREHRLLTLPTLLIGLSTAVMSGIWMLARAQEIYQSLLTHLGSHQAAILTAECFMAGAVFFLPAVLMGALFSHLVEAAQEQRLGVGQAVAMNTLGSALAPMLFGVLLLPAIGGKWSFVFVAMGYVLLLPATNRIWWCFAVVPLSLIVGLPEQLRFVEPPVRGKLLAYRDGVMDSVAVLEHFDKNRTLVVNSRFTMGGTGAAAAERRHADIPLLLHPAPKRALFLGLGTGITFAAAGAHEGLRADGVELVPEVVQALPWFQPFNVLPAAPGQFRIFTADARRFVRACPDQYDVIVADLFHPARDGAGALYALEHFRLMRNRLAPGGLFCQWLPLYQLDEATLRVIVKTFQVIFPEAQACLLRFNVDTPVMGLIGTLAPVRYAPGYFHDRVHGKPLLDQLGSEQLRDEFQLFGCFLAGPRALREFSESASLNTDDHPVVLFQAPRLHKRGSESPMELLLHLLDSLSLDVTDVLETHSEPAQTFARQLSDFVGARNIYLRGLAAETSGDASRAIDAYVESARRSERFSTGYAQCLTIAMQQAKTQPERARELLQRLVEAQPSRPVAAQLLERLARPTVQEP